MSEKNAYAISEKIAQALIEDGKTEGYDLEAGLFGLEFSKLVRQFAVLEAENAGLRKDKQRLDWLQQQKHFDANLQKDGCHKIYALKQAQEFAGRTLREAIDNAIKEETT